MKNSSARCLLPSWLRVSAMPACLALALVFLAPAAAGKVHLKIAVNGAALDAFNNWTAGVPWNEISNFKNGNASRPVVDLILELQALKAGGLDFDFELVRTLTYELAKAELVQGRAALGGETIWDNEIAEHADVLLQTDPVIRNGEFVKGVYVLPTSAALLKLSTLKELQQHVGAVVGTWALDVKTMEDIPLKGVVKKATPEIVYQAVQKQQADLTLAEFSATPDMSSELGGVRLVPVPNCKVAIMGSRSWVISRNAPNAAAVQQALQAGIKVLRENGTIERAYRESGFFNPRVAGWQRLF